jgi:uncharacterized protein (DUF427 family)
MPQNNETESVWDYPRPPRLEPVRQRLIVIFGRKLVADTTQGIRILETSHPPTYYFPPSHVAVEFFTRSSGTSFCEYKGVAEYFTLKVGERTSCRVAWLYPSPTSAFSSIAGYISFYSSRVDGCYVGAEQASAQEGDFYGGWITTTLRGPFKGGAGSAGW